MCEQWGEHAEVRELRAALEKVIPRVVLERRLGSRVVRVSAFVWESGAAHPGRDGQRLARESIFVAAERLVAVAHGLGWQMVERREITIVDGEMDPLADRPGVGVRIRFAVIGPPNPTTANDDEETTQHG